MGGGAFWDSVIIWLTIVPILVFGMVVVLTWLVFRVAGRRIGWGRAALYVLGTFLAFQVIALAVDTLFF